MGLAGDGVLIGNYNKMSSSENAVLNMGVCHILIVEDHELSAQIAGRFLKQMNCTFDWAATGEAALEYYNQKFYDLVLIDIGLPTMDGYELVQKIRETHSFKTYSTPIIALTALDDEKNKRTCLELGMNATFSKPLLKTTAREILEVFVPKWHSEKMMLNCTQDASSVMLHLTGQPISFDQVLKLYDQDIQFVKNALEIVMENFKSEQEKLNNAYQKHNWGTIGEITHKLHGVTRYFGMIRLEQVCVHFAQMLKKYSKITARDYQLLFDEIEQVVVCYQQWLKDLEN